MEIFQEITPFLDYMDTQKAKNLSIGFVPTMGALHRGHIALMQESKRRDSLIVVSIFVNPNQFNNPNDLKRYPRTPDRDMEMCREAGVSVVFMPSVEDIYPEPDTRVFDFGIIDKVMEGKHRPGHFNGVAQVVSRLFDIVKPTRAYFGQKDFQQLAVIKQLVKDNNIGVEVISCPTVRETDGLAMSSRNALLTPAQRASAPLISKTLLEARNKVHSISVKETLGWVVEQINSDPLLSVEYFSIVNAETLEEIQDWSDAETLVGCIAVNAGPIRLIDNIFINPEN